MLVAICTNTQIVHANVKNKGLLYLLVQRQHHRNPFARFFILFFWVPPLLPPQQTPRLNFFWIFFQVKANRSCWQPAFPFHLPAWHTPPPTPRHSSPFSQRTRLSLLQHPNNSIPLPQKFLRRQKTRTTSYTPNTHGFLPEALQPAFLFFFFSQLHLICIATFSSTKLHRCR